MSKFAIRHLHVLSYAQGFTSWVYRDKDAPIVDMASPGFFDDAADMLAIGDMIALSGSVGGRIVFVTAISPTVRVEAPI